MKRRTFIKNGILGLWVQVLCLVLYYQVGIVQLLHPIYGPYWSPNHPQRNILANSEEPGTRIFISGIVTADDCETPIQNAIVDVWHANDDGCYTIFQECQSGNSNNDLYNLRGIIITDQNGYYTLNQYFPGITGRPRHFHYKITSPSGLELVTQNVILKMTL